MVNQHNMKFDNKVDIILKEFAFPISITRLGTDPEVVSGHVYTWAKIADPTGVLTIPDLVSSIQEANKNPSTFNIFVVVLNLICVVPGLTYYGKAIRVAMKTGKFALASTKFNVAVNLILAGTIEGLGYIYSLLPEGSKLNLPTWLEETKEEATPEGMEEFFKTLEAHTAQLNAGLDDNKSVPSKIDVEIPKLDLKDGPGTIKNTVETNK